MINELLLLSGNDIPLEKLNLLFHPPTVREIAYIGEDAFFTGCEVLRFSKENLSEEDKNHLENISNFNIIMSIIREKNEGMHYNKQCVLQVLSLLFPSYKISLDFDKSEIIFKQDDIMLSLNEKNYDIFLEALNEILVLGGGDKEYNPAGGLANKIAEKLKRGRQKVVAKESKSNQKVAILSRYISILAVGENKDMNALLNYSLYQLFDEFKRFQLKLAFDAHQSALLAGAKSEDLGEVKDWMKDIHSNDEDEEQ